MNKINFRKVTALPATPVINSLYILKDPVDKKFTLHIADSVGADFYDLNPSAGLVSINLDTNKAVTGTVTTIKITNYDADTVYNISSTTAVIVLNGDTFTYKTSQSTGYVDNLVINGITKPITIIAPSVDKPVVTLIDTSPNGEPSHALLKSSPVKDSYNNALLSVDWEISLRPSFNTIYGSSYLDTVNLTYFITPFLKPSVTYYARVRHQTSIGYSAWSNTISITTSATCDVKYQQQKLFPFEKGVGNNTGAFNFGLSQAITPDGTRMVVGSPNSDVSNDATQNGAVYVYKRGSVEDLWFLEKTIIPSFTISGQHFGWAVDINDAGDTIVVGAPAASITFTNNGCIHVYKRVGNIWYEHTSKKTPLDPRSADNFGYSVAISNDGNVIAVGAPKGSSGVVNSTPGAGYIFINNNGVYNQEYKIAITSLLSSSLDNTARLGQSIAISDDGKTIAIGASAGDAITTTFARTGVVFVYNFSSMLPGNVVVGNTQKLIRNVTDMTTVDGANFGFSLAMTGKGDQIVVGCPNRTVNGFGNAGCAYYFNKDTAGTWTLRQKIQPSVSEASAFYGMSLAGTIDFGKIVIGCNLKDVSARTDAGAAYVYTKSNDLNQFANATATPVAGPAEQILTADDYLANDQFGRSVSISSYPITVNVGGIASSGNLSNDTGAVYTFRHI